MGNPELAQQVAEMKRSGETPEGVTERLRKVSEERGRPYSDDAVREAIMSRASGEDVTSLGDILERMQQEDG